MSMMLPFRKYQGIGNDFILFDGFSHSFPWEILAAPPVARALCHRQKGVGADGLLFILEPTRPQAHACMRIINADGSEAEMCGNGIRCMAKALHDHHSRFHHLQRLSVETGAGLLHCDLTLGAAGKVQSVRVDMGEPRLARESLPMKGTGPFIETMLSSPAGERRWTAVSMGNPHLVTFVDEELDLRALAEHLGPILEHHADFPKRTNVEFARLTPEGVELWVWERGCGITLACGTGACATAVALVVTGRHDASTPLTLHLPGGPLLVQVDPDLRRVWLQGPATEVFQGTIDLDDFSPVSSA
jgi:diaminopimelate epimerase